MSNKNKPLQPEAYAKKNRRKKVAWVIASIGFVGTVSLGIIAFIGQYSGHFTVSLNTKHVSLSLGTSVGDDDNITEPTTNLRAAGLPGTYPVAADSLPADDLIDSDEGGSKNSKFYDGAEHGNEVYFAYTFFAQNAGWDEIPFHLSFRIDDYKVSTVPGAINLIYILRIRVFENTVVKGQPDTHNQITYAYRDSTSADGRAVISPGAKTAENLATAEPFEGTESVFNLPRTFYAQQLIRYTVVAWLEGWDPECSGQEPANSSITFSLHITADDAEGASSSSSSSSESSSNS